MGWGVFYLWFIFFPVIRSINRRSVVGGRERGTRVASFEGVAPLALAAAQNDVCPIQETIDGGA